MQYVCSLTRFTRLCVTSHSQPLINAKHKFQVTNYLQTIFESITNEPIGLIILITSWLTINIAPFTLGQMNIIIEYIMSVSIMTGKRRYHSCLSLVLYRFVRLV
jgi:hypothetical protein